MSEMYRVHGTDITRQQLASKLGVTRMTLYGWLKQPERMPLGAYKKLKALGIEADNTGDSYSITKCDNCDGAGILFIKRVAPTQAIQQEGEI